MTVLKLKPTLKLELMLTLMPTLMPTLMLELKLKLILLKHQRSNPFHGEKELRACMERLRTELEEPRTGLKKEKISSSRELEALAPRLSQSGLVPLNLTNERLLEYFDINENLLCLCISINNLNITLYFNYLLSYCLFSINNRIFQTIITF